MDEIAFAKRPSENPDENSKKPKEYFRLAKNGNIELADRAKSAEIFAEKTADIVRAIEGLNKRLKEHGVNQSTRETISGLTAKKGNEMLNNGESMFEPLYLVTAIERIIELYTEKTWFGFGEKNFLELSDDRIKEILNSLDLAFVYLKDHEKGKFLKTRSKVIADDLVENYQVFTKSKEEMFAHIDQVIKDTPESWFYQPKEKIGEQVFVADSGLGDQSEKKA